jgi:hypothetical protein
MPLLFIGTGLVLILTGIKGDPSKLWALVQGDFSGQNNFVYWLVAMLILGGLGYIPALRNLSRLFIVLVVIVLLLDNKGFFVQAQSFINSGNKNSSSANPTTTNTATVTPSVGG